MRFRLCHLYPDLMNLYGDRGNVIALTRRLEWRGVEVESCAVVQGETVDFSAFDLLFMGGGQDKEQKLICEDFQRVKGNALTEAIEDGTPFLAICGGYQLLGHYYETGTGDRLPGIGVMDIVTRAGSKRMIGNVVAVSRLEGTRRTLVGFENHSGRTYLGPETRPLAQVCVGHGNNGEDDCEGAVFRNVVGTYLHGSLLPKNPWLADLLIERGMSRRQGREVRLDPLADEVERTAHQAAVAHARAMARAHRTPVDTRLFRSVFGRGSA